MIHDTRLSQRPWLEEYDDPQAIALRRIDAGYFIVKNNIRKKLEVHNTNNTGRSTYCFTVPFPLLDARTVDYCRMTYTPYRGREITAEGDRSNEAIKNAADKEYADHIHDISVDTAKDLRLAADKDLLHDGYRKTHTVS